MAMALHGISVAAVSYTGAQAGIFTDKVHTKAKIKMIDPKPLEKDLNEGRVVIVAGFQGIDEEGQITTLGRGGSDLTAVALAAALKADRCEIYTDVDGVYTADPRVVKAARKLPEISYDEMLELASAGSKVMQSRSVEFAKKYGVVFEVRSSFNHNPGTLVKEEVAYMEQVVVRGIAADKDQAKVVVSSIPDKPGSAAKVFRALADANVIVDMIVQNVGHKGVANLTFTVPQTDTARAVKALEPVARRDRRRAGRRPRADREALGRRRRHEDAQRRRGHALRGPGRASGSTSTSSAPPRSRSPSSSTWTGPTRPSARPTPRSGSTRRRAQGAMRYVSTRGGSPAGRLLARPWPRAWRPTGDSSCRRGCRTSGRSSGSCGASPTRSSARASCAGSRPTSRRPTWPTW